MLSIVVTCCEISSSSCDQQSRSKAELFEVVGMFEVEVEEGGEGVGWG